MESRVAVVAVVLAALATAGLALASWQPLPAAPVPAPEFLPLVGPPLSSEADEPPKAQTETEDEAPHDDPRPAGASWTPAHVEDFGIPAEGALATGLVGIPSVDPTTLVLLAHPYGVTSDHYRVALQELADRGVLAVSMDFRGDRDAYKVSSGVEDTVAAALHLKALHPGIDRTLLYGHSMGGEVALVAAADAPPGTFDYVFVGAGVTDLEALWHANPTIRPQVERETGGTPGEVPDAYAQRSPVDRIADLAAQGVTRYFVVHGAGDAPVPVDHAEKLYEALSAAGLPVSYYVVTTDDDPLYCVPLAQLCPDPMPATHWAGRFDLMLPFIGNRIDRLPDPEEPALRGTYEGDSGKYEPSDVGGD